VALRDLCRDARSLANQSFSGVRQLQVEVRRVPRFVPGNVVPCTPRGRLPPALVLWEWVRLFRLPEPRGPAAVPVARRGVPVNATFRAA
jgi:hypothetical protein